MADYQVTCVTPDGNDADRRIDSLGGINSATGDRWYDTIDNVIAAITNGHTFWVSVGGWRVNVIVRYHPHSLRPYLTTEGDGFPPNNLLNLPHCA